MTIQRAAMAPKMASKAKPKPTDNVQVHYTVWTTDGKVVDSTLPSERPKTLPLKLGDFAGLIFRFYFSKILF